MRQSPITGLDVNGPIVPRAPGPYAKLARATLARRRQLEHLFDGVPFADPSRDILLDLFAANEEGRGVSVSSCCIAAHVPPTTALRWIGILAKKGVVVIRDDKGDGRRRMITLSEDAQTSMRRYFDTMLSFVPSMEE